jgi:hypothetical protein
MLDVNVTPFEIETRTWYGNMVRADVYLPKHARGPVPILLGASPYEKGASPSVLDASGSPFEKSEETSRRRMDRAGVWLRATNTMIAELVQDWSTPHFLPHECPDEIGRRVLKMAARAKNT